MKLSLRHVLVFAPDLSRARDFHGEVLGIPLHDSSDTHQQFRGENFDLTVFSCDGQDSPRGYSEQAGSAIAFTVPSIDDAAAELAAQNVALLHSSPQQGPLGKYVAFVDPFGVVHELVEEGS